MRYLCDGNPIIHISLHLHTSNHPVGIVISIVGLIICDELLEKPLEERAYGFANSCGDDAHRRQFRPGLYVHCSADRTSLSRRLD
ncbi:hypothetical protein KC19_2G111800 [Ceratodon purpureus]|uniref:Uncharacterized protein n=1 Tax=Ceratodon purpureus TaxID=3225 RepID=A0A8T0IVL1_CERPU|nr:hypothetical protein KC19_2G111800 [Ceratodon purpureus]